VAERRWSREGGRSRARRRRHRLRAPATSERGGGGARLRRAEARASGGIEARRWSSCSRNPRTGRELASSASLAIPTASSPAFIAEVRRFRTGRCRFCTGRRCLSCGRVSPDFAGWIGSTGKTTMERGGCGRKYFAAGGGVFHVPGRGSGFAACTRPGRGRSAVLRVPPCRARAGPSREGCCGTGRAMRQPGRGQGRLRPKKRMYTEYVLCFLAPRECNHIYLYILIPFVIR